MIRLARPSLALLLLAAAAPALAHPGHGAESGLAAGMLHPLTGIDHLLAMIMVGLWSGLAFPRHWWVCPAAFVSFMLGGFAYGAAGGPLPIAEMLIVASVAALGIALLFDVRPPLALSAAAIALFAIGHGFAHGHEMAPGSDGLCFAAGFIATTLALHAAGFGLSRLALRLQPRRIGQAVGFVATATAAAMIWSA
ncbi:HupE/UreJ family protein [Flavisphingomonas formosensis]|uniref:HupE/UreJ family protein n=1 Tax=Flavisphingomonas formosensis TaxID=861534 RepID=UPI0012F837F2|nr:HupE/UreJ family protein [Sphingomonas formosensis]